MIAVATGAVVYASSMLGPLQEAIRVDLHLSDNAIAALQGSALGVPMALGSIPLGLLVDRISRATLLRIVVVLALAASAVTALSSSLIMLFAARCIVGLAVATVLVASYALAADLYAPEQRGRATMIVALGENGGAPAAFALGGLLLTMMGAGPEAWRKALLSSTAMLVPVALLVLLLREPPRTGIVVSNPQVREVWPELWAYRGRIAPLLLARIMVWMGDGAVQIWAAPIFARTYGLTPQRIGGIIALGLLASATLGPALGGLLADFCQRRGGPRRTMIALSLVALISAPTALFAIMASSTVAGILLGVFLTLGYVIGVAAVPLGTIVVPGELRGLYIAITIAVSALFSVALAPLAVSSLSGALGGPAMIGEAMAIVGTVTSLLGSAVFAFGGRHFPTAHGPDPSGRVILE